MPFKTLDEAHEFELSVNKKIADLTQAKTGLETKLKDTESLVATSQKEIDRLKIKNYEYFEQLSLQQNEANKQQPNNNNTSNEDNTSIDDIINDFK